MEENQLDKADPEKQDAFRQPVEDLKKLLSEEIDVMLVEDESMIRDYPAIMKTWFPAGKQRIIRLTESMRASNWSGSWIMKRAVFMWRNIKNMMLRYKWSKYYKG